MTAIHDLPLETIEEILVRADPIDVAKLSQTSRLFARLIYEQEDQHLWRWLYLCQDLDDPRECVYINGECRDAAAIDWMAEVKSLMRARTVLDDVSVWRPSERCTVLETIIKLVEWLPPCPAQSRNLVWVHDYLADGRLIDDHKVTWSETAAERQLRSKLHTYYGQSPEDQTPSALVRARAYVYDFRHYNWATDFGPFLEDGNVDWVFILSLRLAISVHADDDEMQIARTQLSLPREQEWEHDWAGIEGVWDCNFAFCDHLSLMEYNQSSGDSGGLNTFLFDNPEHGDVFRSLRVTLRIIQVTADPAHPRHPRIHFGGDIGVNSSATMSGYVYMSKDNQVRWRFRAGEQMNPIWSSEGVQIGGLRAAYGVLGTWTTSFHHTNDPVGPFWYRKSTEQDTMS